LKACIVIQRLKARIFAQDSADRFAAFFDRDFERRDGRIDPLQLNAYGSQFNLDAQIVGLGFQIFGKNRFNQIEAAHLNKHLRELQVEFRRQI